MSKKREKGLREKGAVFIPALRQSTTCRKGWWSKLSSVSVLCPSLRVIGILERLQGVERGAGVRPFRFGGG